MLNQYIKQFSLIRSMNLFGATLFLSIYFVICLQSVFAADPYMCLMKCKVNCEDYLEKQKELRSKGDQFGGPNDIYEGCIEPCFWRCDANKGDGVRACRLEWDDNLGKCLREGRLSETMCWQLWRKYSEKCFENINN